MTIPHPAIVSGLLLASDDPSVVAGFIAAGDPPGINFKFIERPYNGDFRTVGLWRRGFNKWLWCDELLKRQSLRETTDNAQMRIDLYELKGKMDITLYPWLLIGLQAFFLIFAPCALAFLTSFLTPRVGLSCRSLTFLVYFGAQLIQIIVWWVRTWGMINAIQAGQNPNSVPGPFARTLFWIIEGLVAPCAVFSGVGGTFMQMMGVYRNCLCKVRWHL
jgi:hypothetical protein